MRVLIVSVDFPPHTDGVSTVSHELATRLTESGEEIIVVGPKSKGDKIYDSKQKFKVIRTPFYEWGYLRFVPIFFVMPWVIMRYRIKRVLPMNIAYGGVISYLFFKYLKFSYVMWAYGYEFAKFETNPFVRNLYLKIYENSLFVVAITNFVKNRLIEFGVKEEKVVVIKPGTDPLKYRPIEISEDFRRNYGLENKKVIMTVGRLLERKGIDMTIRAVKEVIKKYPDIIYLVVGQGPYRKRLEILAQEEGVRHVVRFMGRISDTELLKFYNLSDVFIMPSRTLDKKGDIEGFGIVFLEAGACGKPVIGGLDGGMGEAIENGITGLLVNSRKPEEISRAILKILSDKDYARQLGENGRRRVIEEFNWERAIREFHNYLRDSCTSSIIR